MIHNPILLSIRARGKACVYHAMGALHGILIENTSLVVLTPVLGIHGIIADKFRLAKTVVPVIGSIGGIDDGGLIGD